MPIQHSPPEKRTTYQARAQAVPTPTTRTPLDGTPAVLQLRAQFGRRLSRSTFKFPGEDGEEEEANSVEEEGSDANDSDYGQSLDIFIFGGIKTTSLQYSIYEGTRMIGWDSVLQIQKLYSVLDSKWIEPYLSNLTNQDSNCLLNSWISFESQLFTLFGDPNEFRKAEEEFYSLRMKEGDWGERALNHHFRKGFPSRILDQLTSHPSRIDSLQALIDITLELDTSYHERQKEKSHHQEKKPEASKSNSSHPQSS
ncbi:hypothetical protein O181_009041 [Austropuccinia psidii MF-1]|uniref:Retrotransposon gag domain-containing protein n=1 Tax=Austropuccinia psidii MF-1 TaxID=1389203 RepID=A0A9Q3BR07_9BASI|nr:hypothetical protein [Austropuccinia psidii MF-1]